MKKLNLVHQDKSDIAYKISKFPDGQQQVTILGDKGGSSTTTSEEDINKVAPLSEINKNEEVKISARLNDFKDLELIICATASLREAGFTNISLYTPYFLGSRSDRKFEEGSNNYLKTVICPIINSLGFTKVTVLDPHSDVLEACLNNFNKQSNKGLVCYALQNIAFQNNKHPDEPLLISPDAGANKKIYKLAEEINYKGEIITCSKSRDVDGKLSKTEVPISIEMSKKDLIIIDDICDGGATFINIAEKIQNFRKAWASNPQYYGKLYLVVTHGIFSKGFEELNKYFDDIYCTNSYSDIPENYSNGMQKFKTNVKQINVF